MFTISIDNNLLNNCVIRNSSKGRLLQIMVIIFYKKHIKIYP